MKNNINSDPPDKLQIHLLLDGADAVTFRRYKENQFIKRDAEAARKLLLERLAQLTAAATEAAA